MDGGRESFVHENDQDSFNRAKIPQGHNLGLRSHTTPENRSANELFNIESIDCFVLKCGVDVSDSQSPNFGIKQLLAWVLARESTEKKSEYEKITKIP